MLEFIHYVVGHQYNIIPTYYFTSCYLLKGIKRVLWFLYNTMYLKKLKVLIQRAEETGYCLSYLYELGVKLSNTDDAVSIIAFYKKRLKTINWNEKVSFCFLVYRYSVVLNTKKVK